MRSQAQIVEMLKRSATGAAAIQTIERKLAEVGRHPEAEPVRPPITVQVSRAFRIGEGKR